MREEGKSSDGGGKQRWFYTLGGSGASGRVAVGATAARAVSEEFPVQATAVSCCGITDMNNTKQVL